jgi:hypothetical protein
MALQRIEGYGQVADRAPIAKKDALTEFIRSSGERLGGIAAKALVKREGRQYLDERAALYAKLSQKMYEGLEGLRNRNESNPVRKNFKRTFIGDGLKDGSIPGWAANELNKITTLNLELKLYPDNKRRLTDTSGNVYTNVGMPTNLPPQNIERGDTEALAQQEAATANEATRVAPTASQAAEDTIVSGLPKNPIKHKVYALQARRFNNRTVAMGQFFSSLKGEELYASVTHKDDIGTFEEMTFGEVQAHISGIMNEFEGMVIKLADDPDATVNPKDMKHYSRALKKDVLDMYMGNKGAKLALGPKFPVQLEDMFDKMDQKTDLIIEKAFAEGTDDTNLKILKNVNSFMEATDSLKLNKIIASFGPKENQIRAKISYFKSMALINKDFLTTGGLAAFKVSVENSLNPFTKITVDTSREKLKTFSKSSKGKKLSIRAKEIVMRQIEFLLSSEAFMASGGDFEGIDADIRAAMTNIKFEDDRERQDILRSLDEYKDRAAKAKVVGKPWFDGIVKFFGGD